MTIKECREIVKEQTKLFQASIGNPKQQEIHKQWVEHYQSKIDDKLAMGLKEGD